VLQARGTVFAAPTKERTTSGTAQQHGATIHGQAVLEIYQDGATHAMGPIPAPPGPVFGMMVPQEALFVTSASPIMARSYLDPVRTQSFPAGQPAEYQNALLDHEEMRMVALLEKCAPGSASSSLATATPTVSQPS
jgi:hypothetical protein